MRHCLTACITFVLLSCSVGRADPPPGLKPVVAWTERVDKEVFPKLVWPETLAKAGDIPNVWNSLPTVYLSSQQQFDEFLKFVRLPRRSPSVDFDNYGVVVVVGTASTQPLFLREEERKTSVAIPLTPPDKEKVNYVVAVFPKAKLEQAIKQK